MQDKEYTIAAVSTQKAPRQWGSNVAMLEYLVKFEGEDPNQIVKLSKKASEPAPTKGDKVTGHIEVNEYGFTFKKAAAQGGAGGRWQRDTKDIRAQMAVKAAADYCAQTGKDIEEIGPLAHKLYQLVDVVKEDATKEAAPTDELKKDVEAALGGKTDDIDLSEIPF